MKLPKWPRLYVTGEAVTEEQADLIIVRTSDLGFLCNDEEWCRIVYRTFGVAVEKDGTPSYEDREATRARFGMLDLQYLNTDRIASTEMEGPSGWCHWDGTISGVDVGLRAKWPHIDELFGEWNAIARAFPFLRLTAQLTTGGWEKEGDDGTSREVLVQWEVARGVVSMVTPGPLLHPVPVDDALDRWERRTDEYLDRRDAVRRRGWGFEPVRDGTERGTTWARLKTAVERARIK